MTDIVEPTESQKLEAMRTAVAFIRMIDGRLTDLLTYWSTLDEYEQGCALGALSQLALVGVHAMAAVRGCSFDAALTEIDTEAEAAVTGKQAKA